jgi:hypothetical protein
LDDENIDNIPEGSTAWNGVIQFRGKARDEKRAEGLKRRSLCIAPTVVKRSTPMLNFARNVEKC